MVEAQTMRTHYLEKKLARAISFQNETEVSRRRSGIYSHENRKYSLVFDNNGREVLSLFSMLSGQIFDGLLSVQPRKQ